MIISVGMTIYTVYDDFRHFLDPRYSSPAMILIFVGGLIFIIAFFGCYGAIKESTCMVLTVRKYYFTLKRAILIVIIRNRIFSLSLMIWKLCNLCNTV